VVQTRVLKVAEDPAVSGWQIEGLKASLASLQKVVDDLQAAQRSRRRTRARSRCATCKGCRATGEGRDAGSKEGTKYTSPRAQDTR